MSSLDRIVERVRGEFMELPGLRLTVPQACRLWGLDRATCEAVMTQLIAEDFLQRIAGDPSIGLMRSPHPVKAPLSRAALRKRIA